MGHVINGEEEEIEAKFFAKYALAPPPLIHNMKGKISPLSIMECFDLSFEAAKNAYSYYQKWLRFGGKKYRGYEVEMLDLFDVA